MRWRDFDWHTLLEDIGSLKSRVERLERQAERAPFRWGDLLPALWGLAVLAAALSGRITWSDVPGLLGLGR